MTATEFKIYGYQILNSRNEMLFESGDHDGHETIDNLHITELGLRVLCGLLNSGGAGLSEQGEPLYGSSLDDLRVRIASLYDENRALRDENAGLKRQLERGKRSGRFW